MDFKNLKALEKKLKKVEEEKLSLLKEEHRSE